MDWTNLLRSQQIDFIRRLQSRSAILHQLTNPQLTGYHSEMIIISGEILAQIRQECETIAHLKSKLGALAVQSYLDPIATPIDPGDRTVSDRPVYFRLTNEPNIRIIVKTEGGNSETIRWHVDLAESEDCDVMVCILIPETSSDFQAEYQSIFAGFLPIRTIGFQNGEASVKIDDLLYSGGLKAYLQSLLWNCWHTLAGHADAVLCVAIAPDGQTIVSGSRDKTIKVWNLETGTEIRTLQGHLDAVNAVAFSDRGNLIASGSSDKTISIWDLQTGESLRTLYGHSDNVDSVIFSPDGQTLASSSGNKIILIWDLVTGEVIRTIDGSSTMYRPVAISPDGQAVVGGSVEKTIKIWNLKTGELISSIDGHAGAIESVAFSPDGRTLVSGSADKTVKIWRRDRP